MNDSERLLSTNEAAGILGLDPTTLKRWRTRGGGPVYSKVSANRCRYRLDALKEFIAQREQRSTADTPESLMAAR